MENPKGSSAISPQVYTDIAVSGAIDALRMIEHALPDSLRNRTGLGHVIVARVCLEHLQELFKSGQFVVTRSERPTA